MIQPAGTIQGGLRDGGKRDGCDAQKSVLNCCNFAKRVAHPCTRWRHRKVEHLVVLFSQGFSGCFPEGFASRCARLTELPCRLLQRTKRSILYPYKILFFNLCSSSVVYQFPWFDLSAWNFSDRPDLQGIRLLLFLQLLRICFILHHGEATSLSCPWEPKGQVRCSATYIQPRRSRCQTGSCLHMMCRIQVLTAWRMVLLTAFSHGSPHRR